MNPSQFNVGTATVGQVPTRQSADFQVKSTFADVLNNQVNAAQGQVSDQAQIDVEDVTLDLDRLDKGLTGQALKEAATQGISAIVDTSTVSGKLLAQTLGEGNYTDSKATILGQMDIISKEFVDSNGEPKIPSWAASTARSVSKIAAFNGMTGSAATQTMATAIMEASLTVAGQEAQFFQTVTLQNLNNRQQQTINRANVLSRMELANLDNRMAAAVQNSKHFMEMDLTNLANEQQARIINNQSRIQSILEDARQENTRRLFVAESTNDLNKFYDQLKRGYRNLQC